MAGSDGRPARLAARQRRSPAINSYRSSPKGRTSTGWSTPSSRTDAVSDARASSSKAFRGWLGLVVRLLTGSSVSDTGPVSALATSDGISAPSPLPSPLPRATSDLPCQFPVGDGPPRGWIECRDRLPVGGRLREPYRAGHD